MKKVFNETTKKFINLGSRMQPELHYGIVYICDDYLEYGYFTEPKNPVCVRIMEQDFDRTVLCYDFDTIKDYLLFSKSKGCYFVAHQLNAAQRRFHSLIKGNGDFPYSFARMYEAADNFKIFKDKQVVEKPTHFLLSEYMPYTFGLEFETSMGYIPEERCYKDGLIPLRDGSITGLEYSTVVLQGDQGLSLLFNQQLADLEEYTEFNKECSLHVHMGSFPITPKHVFAVYVICKRLEPWLANNLAHDTFKTSRYKASGKDYCNLLPPMESFRQLYEWLTGTPFFGSLTQAHPCDIAKNAKWKIHQRYLWLNLINMVCYTGPKTIEFRFLRPTFNKRIIMMWLWVFNAILLAAEYLANGVTDEQNLNLATFVESQRIRGMEDLLKMAYPESIAEAVLEELDLYTTGVQNQHTNGDYCGRDTYLLDKIMTGDSPLL